MGRFNETKLSFHRREQREKLEIKDDNLILLHVRSGFMIKGLDGAVMSMSHLIKKRFKVELIVLGKDRRCPQKCQKICD